MNSDSWYFNKKRDERKRRRLSLSKYDILSDHEKYFKFAIREGESVNNAFQVARLAMEMAVEKNGKPTPTETQQTLENLEHQLTSGYRPQLPIEGMFTGNGLPLMSLRFDIENMLTHPDVRQALGYFRGGIAGAEFWGGPNPDNPEDEQGLPICQENPQVGRFIKEQCERFWDRGVPHLQRADEYGWIGSEQIYDDCDGVLKWENLYTFSPRDTYLLTQDFQPVGVRVKNVQQSTKPIDLWMAGENVPAKGIWYAHQPRYNSFYGQSQLYAAWRPWRRLAFKDGAESVIDGAVYRAGYQGPLGRYPDEDLIGPQGVPNTTVGADGKPRRYARDIMRQICEQAKAGAAIGLPSKRDGDGNYLYDLVMPTQVLQGINGLIDYVKYLRDQITAGIGVPPELIQAADSGSGYSGRRIPLEAFLANQQQIADAMLRMFIHQVLRPLVLWNFGKVRFNVQVKSLIKTRTKAAQGGQQGQQDGGPDPDRSEAAKRAWETRRGGGGQQNQAMFSHQSLITDRMRDIARKALAA